MPLALSPHGRIYPETAAADADELPAAVLAALERGAGAGILELGAAAIASQLGPTAAFWRDLGRLFLTRLTGVPDLETVRAEVALEPPLAELRALCEAAPPMTGGEYLDETLLGRLWDELGAAFRQQMASWDGTVEQWLHARDPVWNLVGRVCFHLAENPADETRPFAFLATYTTRLSPKARPQHRPLGEAVRGSAAARDRRALLALLAPVDRAAQKSALVQEMVRTGSLFQPLAWTPREAHRFLREVPLFEESGIVVRVPDWWRPRRPPRVQVSVHLGAKPPAGLGTEAVLDFQLELAIDKERLTQDEWQQLLDGTDGLVRLRGRWVEIDRQRLRDVLEHWREVERAAADGLPFLQGMRLLAGAESGPATDDGAAVVDREWLRIEPGAWLEKVLEGLRSPDGLTAVDPGSDLRAELRPYQRVGLGWLWLLTSLGLGACLADDMGLGKTIEVLALVVARRRHCPGAGPHLLVVPASLLANWQAEIERFAPALRVLVAHPSVTPAASLAELAADQFSRWDVVLATYGQMHRVAALRQARWDLVVLDEAQAIKNPATRQARAVKELRGCTRIALTGTPVENRLADLWSLFDFLNPGLLGSAAEFGRAARRLAARSEDQYGPLRRLVRPYILRRLKSDRRVIQDLPDKTEVKAYCSLSRAQAALYQQSVDELRRRLQGAEGIERRGVILSYLLRLKQICNHPSQWLGDGRFAPGTSGKLERLAELCEPIAERQEKVLVFTQFREMTEPLRGHLAGVFGRPGLTLHGQTPVRDRMGLVERFQGDDAVPFFVLSVKAGGTGLNLTAASHVVHFDRWWNPAVENQATDRAYRIGQRKNVVVHKLICRGTVEEKIDAMIERKQGLSAELIESGGEALLTELDDRALLETVQLDLSRALAED
jgi:non-specific serine/threonine protein kinase